MDILKRIAEYRAREEQLVWEGTFAEYLEIVRKKSARCPDRTLPGVQYDQTCRD